MPLSNEKTGKQKGINWNRKTTKGPLFIPSCFVNQFEMLYFDNRWGNHENPNVSGTKNTNIKNNFHKTIIKSMWTKRAYMGKPSASLLAAS